MKVTLLAISTCRPSSVKLTPWPFSLLNGTAQAERIQNYLVELLDQFVVDSKRHMSSKKHVHPAVFINKVKATQHATQDIKTK